MDCLDGMKLLEDNSVDSIITDPPYNLTSKGSKKGFMGKKWDGTEIAFNTDIWKECLRVLKPGGYLLSFGGTRTYHRMVCAIEDAGFIIHPMIAWINSQGFPKATNLSKQFDKQACREELINKLGRKPTKEEYKNAWKNYRKISSISKKQPAGFIRHGRTDEEVFFGADKNRKQENITIPATPEAKQWDGWYYGLQSLKPAVEPICFAQKPIDGKRMTDNVRKWGVGAINVDGCRVGTGIYGWGGNPSKGYSGGLDSEKPDKAHPVDGRFPANLILDEEAGRLLDEQSGVLKSGATRNDGVNKSKLSWKNTSKNIIANNYVPPSSGGASRFFKNIQYEEPDFLPFYYCGKASKKERGEYNTHVTVKPLKLIKYLTKLTTPPGGISLDPFAGSGTHALACIELGFNYIGFELEKEYCSIAEKRIAGMAK